MGVRAAARATARLPTWRNQHGVLLLLLLPARLLQGRAGAL